MTTNNSLQQACKEFHEDLLKGIKVHSLEASDEDWMDFCAELEQALLRYKGHLKAAYTAHSQEMPSDTELATAVDRSRHALTAVLGGLAQLSAKEALFKVITVFKVSACDSVVGHLASVNIVLDAIDNFKGTGEPEIISINNSGKRFFYAGGYRIEYRPGANIAPPPVEVWDRFIEIKPRKGTLTGFLGQERHAS